MAKLKFNSESAKEDYLKLYDDLAFDDKKLSLMLIRGELLARNEHFVRDWLELEKHKKNKDYNEKEEVFCEKWRVDNLGLFNLRREPDPIVKGRTGRPLKNSNELKDHFGYCTLEVDLRYSKKKIMEQIKLEIDKYYKWYREDSREREDEFGYNLKLKSPDKVSGNIPIDLKDYGRYIQIWDLKEQKKSWFQIQKELDISFDTARNWHKRACELIMEGIPGFPSFPQE